MKKFRLNWYFWFLSVLLIFVLVFGGKMAYALFTNQVQDENGLIDPLTSLILAVIFAFIWVIYAISGITMLNLAIKNKFNCLEITDKGIENTAVFVNFFALIIILPIKFIPWEAVKSYENDVLGLRVRVHTDMVESGFLAKLILKITGYQFCQGIVKPKVTDDDLAPYKHRFSTENKSF